jgi:exosortase
MVSIWARSDTFAHGFLVVPIVLWLVWRQRHALAVVAPTPSAWLLGPMAAVAFVWLLGDLASVNSVTQLALTALLVLAVPAVLGLPAAKVIVFPLAFLFFAVPLGEFLLPQLMSWTATSRC